MVDWSGFCCADGEGDGDMGSAVGAGELNERRAGVVGTGGLRNDELTLDAGTLE